MSDKVKLYKNPARKSVPSGLKPYVPQYQLMGVEPEEYNSPTSASYKIAQSVKPQPLPLDNPRASRPLIRQPYAEAVPSPIGRGKGPIPNVGNNIEQTWSSVDGEIVDDLDVPMEEMIDNNDFVTEEALGEVSIVERDPHEKEMVSAPKTFLTEDELQNALKEEFLNEIIKQLPEGDYLLLLDDNAVCSGPLEEVQEQARGLVFGEHPLCHGQAVPLEDIVVVKRVQLKVGLFLE